MFRRRIFSGAVCIFEVQLDPGADVLTPDEIQGIDGVIRASKANNAVACKKDLRRARIGDCDEPIAGAITASSEQGYEEYR